MDGNPDMVCFPGGWKIGDRCRVITNRKKKLTSEYEILEYDGKYYLLRSSTGTLHRASPGRLFRTHDEAATMLLAAEKGGMPMNEWERLSRRAEGIKARYPKGTIVCLGLMEGEAGMPQGLKGTVALVDDIGQIHVNWENGSSLALDTEADSFRVVSRPKKERGEPSR